MLHKYISLLEDKIIISNYFPCQINMSWNRGEETGLEISDEEFEIVKERFRNYKLSRSSVICGGENDPSIEEYVLVEKVYSLPN